MRAELFLGGFLFNLLSNCHGGPAECNTTFEFGHNTRLSLQSPKQRTGASLVCWYNLQIIEGSGLEVFQIYVNRFSVGTLEPSGCVGGYLQIHDSEYESVNKVQSLGLGLEKVLFLISRNLVFTVERRSSPSRSSGKPGASSSHSLLMNTTGTPSGTSEWRL